MGIVNILNFSFSPWLFFPNDEVGNDIEKTDDDKEKKTGGELVEMTDNEKREDPEGGTRNRKGLIWILSFSFQFF